MTDLREMTVAMMPKQAIRLFSGPYVAGDSMDAALTKANELSHDRIASTIDVLGEDAATDSDIAEYVRIYERLIDRVSGDPRFAALPENLRPSISLKPSSFIIAPKDPDGQVINPAAARWDECAATIGRVVTLAVQSRVRITIDMENHQWTDFTLKLHRSLFQQHGPLVGTVIQSRLFRTGDDVEQLPDGCRIRLCIGIYNEPPEFAIRDMDEMKARMIPLARRLFEKGVYVEFATHDIPLIRRFVTEVIVPGHIHADRFETQTLLGVPRQKLISELVTGGYFAGIPGGNGADASLRSGIVHRMYVPFAEHWDKAIAYCRRRLKHSPNLFWTGFVNAPRVLYHSFRGK
ncbi:MAG: proline dehydrogenase family protein [Candidatus Zixiibacteriota bacterium]